MVIDEICETNHKISKLSGRRPEVHTFQHKHNPLTFYNDLKEVGIPGKLALTLGMIYEFSVYVHIKNYFGGKKMKINKDKDLLSKIKEIEKEFNVEALYNTQIDYVRAKQMYFKMRWMRMMTDSQTWIRNTLTCTDTGQNGIATTTLLTIQKIGVKLWTCHTISTNLKLKIYRCGLGNVGRTSRKQN